jgi:uncharacterized protein
VNLVDANVLLYAVNADAPLHERSRTWLDGALSGADTVGFSWLVLCAFVRLSTKVGLFPSPVSIDDAVEQVDQWIGATSAVIVEPTQRHRAIVRSLLSPIGTGGNLLNDAHLAALAIEHRAAVVSFDRDFERFSGVRRIEPAPVR